MALDHMPVIPQLILVHMVWIIQWDIKVVVQVCKKPLGHVPMYATTHLDIPQEVAASWNPFYPTRVKVPTPPDPPIPWSPHTTKTEVIVIKVGEHQANLGAHTWWCQPGRGAEACCITNQTEPTAKSH